MTVEELQIENANLRQALAIYQRVLEKSQALLLALNLIDGAEVALRKEIASL